MLFKKDKRKEYMKLIGIKYGKDEMKEIKNILKTDMPLNAFKMCITPMIDERKLNQMAKSNINGQNVSRMNALVPLKADQIKEIRKGIDNKLSLNEVEIYRIPQLDAKNMKIVRETLERRNKNKNPVSISKENLKYRDKELSAVLKLEEFKMFKVKDKEKFEEIYKDLPQEKRRNIILEKDLLEKLDSKILKEVEKNNPRYATEIKEVKEIYEKMKLKNEYEVAEKTEEFSIDKAKDTDGDGLTDIEEKNIYFTNEISRDSDSDGKSDYEEVKDKTNPRENNKRKKKEKELER
jgi:hypothetical protein